MRHTKLQEVFAGCGSAVTLLARLDRPALKISKRRLMVLSDGGLFSNSSDTANEGILLAMYINVYVQADVVGDCTSRSRTTFRTESTFAPDTRLKSSVVQRFNYGSEEIGDLEVVHGIKIKTGILVGTSSCYAASR